MPTIVPRYLHPDLSKHVLQMQVDSVCVCIFWKLRQLWTCALTRKHSRVPPTWMLLTRKFRQQHGLKMAIRVCDQAMSWWRRTCSEQGACSFILPTPSGSWAEETFFLFVYAFFWGLFSGPTLWGAMYEHLRVVPPGKRLRVPSCTRPEILGSG